MNEPQAIPKPGTEPTPPSFAEALRFWFKLGWISFGGPTGQIAIMHAELVEKRRWISEESFLHALNFCMVLPGPEAQQLATYLGWRLHRTLGGIVAGSLFVLPSMVILWGLSLAYVSYGKLAWMTAIFDGLKPAVLAIVLAAGLRIGRRVLKNRVMWGVALLAFAGIFFFKLPFPFIVLLAGWLGWLGGRTGSSLFSVTTGHGSRNPASTLINVNALPQQPRPTWGRALRIVALGLPLWWGPILAFGVWLGFDHTLVKQGMFFSKAAMVTFGGAYAVLPYVSQQAVEQFGWLSAGEMLDGLGLAETTPGPLIMVLQFVGFLGAWKFHEPFSPWVAATLGACITTWTTFIPCFLWIFLGAPYVESLRHHQALSAALSTITAAVVGVILSLALWFGIHVLIPDQGGVNLYGIVLASIAFIGMVRWNWGVMPVVLGAGLCGGIRILFS